MPLHLPPPEGSPRWYRWYEQELLKRHVDIQRLWQLAPMAPAPQVGVPFTGVTVPTFFSVPSNLPSVSSIPSSASSGSSVSSTALQYFNNAASATPGDQSWLDPESANGNDLSGAATVSLGTSEYSEYLVLYDSQFNTIPVGATVNGIEIYMARDKASGAGDATETEIYLTKDGTNPVGDNKASSIWGASPDSETKGGSSDLWGTTWTRSEVKSTTFGVMIKIQAVSGNVNANVRSVGYRIYYTV